jgi:hypothetical protein
MLAYTEMRVQVLARMVPAHGMCSTWLIVLTIWNAGVHPDGRSSAAQKHTTCAQNVSDITNSLYILRCWHIPRRKIKFSQVPRLCTEWQLTMNPWSHQGPCEPEGIVQTPAWANLTGISMKGPPHSLQDHEQLSNLMTAVNTSTLEKPTTSKRSP